MTYLTAGPELSAPTYDRHSVDTIKRLQCIRQVKDFCLFQSLLCKKYCLKLLAHSGLVPGTMLRCNFSDVVRYKEGNDMEITRKKPVNLKIADKLTCSNTSPFHALY